MRAFFAIDLPVDAKKRISEIISALQKKHPDSNIRWTKPQNLHVTLQFLPAIRYEDLPALSKKIHAELRQFSAFELTFKTLELFPSSHHPRIISLAIEPNDALSDLSIRIGKKIIESGYEIETRAFRGHLTLARITKPISLEDINCPEIKFGVKGVVFFRSEPSKEGSMYTPLEIFSLCSFKSGGLRA